MAWERSSGGAGFTGDLDFSFSRILRTFFQSVIAMIVPDSIPGLHSLSDFFRQRIVLFVCIGLGVGGYFLYKIRRCKDRAFWFGWIWLATSLLPILNNGIGVADLTGGRYLYIPLAGWAICLAYLIFSLKKRYMSWVFTVVLVAVYASFTHRSNSIMFSISEVSERFLVGFKHLLDEPKHSDGWVVLLPSMHSGKYMLQSSLSPALQVMYGEAGLALYNRISLVLHLEVSDPSDFKYEIGRVGEKVRIGIESGAMFFRKVTYYDQAILNEMDLSFDDVRLVNSIGDYVARNAEFRPVSMIIVPNMRENDRESLIIHTDLAEID